MTTQNSDYTLGDIKIFGGVYAPFGWAFCQGQLLTIAENQALYSLLGIHYGGDGRTTFALPDLRGRVIVGSGDGGEGLTNRYLGEKGGDTAITLTESEIPSHSHRVVATTNSGTSNVPAGQILAAPEDVTASGTDEEMAVYLPEGISNTKLLSLNSETISSKGLGYPHNNTQPYLAVNYIICTAGNYPTFQQ